MVVLGVNAWNEDKKKVTEFVEDKNLKHRILMNGRDVAKSYGLERVPTVLWIDRHGKVAATEVGFHGAGSLVKKTRSLMRAKS